MNLTRDVVTKYGTFARGYTMHIIETHPDHYVCDIGFDERHPILLSIPADSFEE